MRPFRRSWRSLTFLAIAVTAACSEAICVVQVTQDGFNPVVFDECAPCLDPSPPSSCYTTLADALGAAAPGETILVNIGTFAESNLTLDGARLVGAGRHRTVIAGSGLSPTLTAYRGSIQSVTIRSAGTTALSVLFLQSRPQSNDYNVTVADTKLIASGANAVAAWITTAPTSWAPPGGVGFNDVHVELQSPTSSTVGLELDEATSLTVSRLYLDSGAGIGIDALRSNGPVARFVHPIIRVAGAGNGLRRTCNQPLEMDDAAFWYVGLLPDPAGRLIKEVQGSGACIPFAFSGISGIQETSRVEFLDAPIGLTEFRGSSQPFPCPGTNAAANALGSHWYDSTTGAEKVCTSAGWKTLVAS